MRSAWGMAGGRRGDPRSALVMALLVAVPASIHCGRDSTAEREPHGPITSAGGGGQPIEITIFPRDGEVVRDLERPVVMKFSERVNPDDLSFQITPDPGGWIPAWHDARSRVELEHSSPFQADTRYEVEASLASGPVTVVRFTAARPSTLHLIDTAEAAGEIDLDTAWIYRLQRLFQPGRLPDRFTSDAPVRCGTGVLRGFDRVRGELLPSTLVALEPYLVRPDDPRRARFEPMVGAQSKLARVFDPQPHGLFAMIQIDDEDRRPEVTSEWEFVDCDAAPVRIWAPRAFMGHAREGCQALLRWNMYDRFKRLMTREPGDDTYLCVMSDNLFLRQACVRYAGGNSDIDFYLVPSPRLDDDGGWCRSVSPQDRHSPQWIELDRDLSGDDLGATIAHELFHAFQSAWDDWEDGWWQEATATWAEEFIEPEWPTEDDLHFVFDGVRNRQITLDREDGDHEYAIYLFPYYLEKFKPEREQLIAKIWKECEGKRSLDAIDSALGGKLDETFRRFALVNLDTLTYENSYPEPLSLYSLHETRHYPLQDTGGKRVPIDVVLPPLSALYIEISQYLDANDTPLVRFHLDDFARNENLSVHALVNGVSPTPLDEDWSKLTRREFCISREPEWFRNIYLVFGSTERESMTFPVLEISVDTECDLPSGTGQFSIEKERTSRSAGPTVSHFHEQVTGEITFEPFDRKNGEFHGRAFVHLDETIEIHRADYEDEYINYQGRGEVECVLSYPWGNEDADYSLNCAMLEGVTRHWRKVHHDPMTGDTETSGDGITKTDIDDWCIGSHTSGKPKRYQLDLYGSYSDNQPSHGGTRSHSCTWSIHLKRPEAR